MSNIQPIQKGESVPFIFDRGGQSIDGFVCTINVKRLASDTSSITRVIPPDGNTWPGFLTSAETDTLTTGGKPYRLIGILTNASTDEEEQITKIRFNITGSWAD